MRSEFDGAVGGKENTGRHSERPRGPRALAVWVTGAKREDGVGLGRGGQGTEGGGDNLQL